jgi:hypothetical protein
MNQPRQQPEPLASADAASAMSKKRFIHESFAQGTSDVRDLATPLRVVRRAAAMGQKASAAAWHPPWFYRRPYPHSSTNRHLAKYRCQHR